jgi:PLP dependent protein
VVGGGGAGGVGGGWGGGGWGVGGAGAAARAAGARDDFVGTRPDATVLSAGMSSDLEAAVARGATHVRVGSAVLGPRPTIK